jgi:hypothetical protein
MNGHASRISPRHDYLMYLHAPIPWLDWSYWAEVQKYPICGINNHKCEFSLPRDPLGRTYCCTKKSFCKYKGMKPEKVEFT